MKKIAFILVLAVFLQTVNVLAIDPNFEAAASPGSSASDWCAVALMVSNSDFDKTQYVTALKRYVSDKYKTDNLLSKTKSTEWHRIALAANLAGEDATNFDGIDLISDGIFYRENLGKQGLNAYIWALTVLCSGNYPEPDDAIYTKKVLVEKIISAQNADGGFSLAGTTSNCDITAMAIYALSFFAEDNAVLQVIDKALCYLNAVQNDDGSFSDNGVPNAESTAQVIIAYASLGKCDTSDKAFQALMNFKTQDGFCHVIGGETNLMATYQAMCAVAASRKNSAVYSCFGTAAPIDEKSASQPTEAPESCVAETVTQPTVAEKYESETETETNKTPTENFVPETIESQASATVADLKTPKNKTIYLMFLFPFAAICVIIIRRKK